MSELAELAWPRERLHEGLVELARRAGLEPLRAELTPVPAAGERDEVLAAWLESAGPLLGVDCEPVRPRLDELDELAWRAAPALVPLPGASGVLLVLRSSRRGLRVLAPDRSVRRVARADLIGRLAAPVREPRRAALEQLLDQIGLRGRERARAAEALVAENLGASRLGDVFLLRVPAGRSLALQARRSGLVRRLGVVALAHLGVHALFVASWYTIGRGALAGELELGWLQAWALLLITLVPLRCVEAWSREVFTVGVGALFKRRLLAGALKHEPDEIRHQGAGQLLGRVLESEAVEALALSAAFGGLAGAIEVVLAAWVLGLGAGGALHVALLAVWIVAVAVLAVRHHGRARASTDDRLEVSCDLVERIVGHRTRLAQQAPERWHDVEDALLERHFASARRLDRSAVVAGGVLPATWLAAALAALGPAFVAGASVPSLAVAVGGCLLAQQALARLSGGALQVATLLVAWRQVAPLFRAAARAEPAGDPELAATFAATADAADAADEPPALEARGVTYRYAGRDRPALRDASLTVRRGDRVLVVGPSGGGKSTLAAQLTGIRTPTAGRVTAGGFDRATWGAAAWRRRVAGAPQDHENYVFSGSLAYNLLLGRRWPADADDLVEAESVCRELGLGELIERMPAGLLQTVGETGWQLSHGERSRVFVARALLQGADVVLFDESFAALDPESLRRSLACARERSRALVVVAHP